ncbi:LPXTG cell wall anchor domain-containing protein [Dactylosporangium sp. CS-047395]|uniref:LPXTG cell wall anchor domain-containing protein n=1 Tax=Dactylosporangium sp. CS-047395 TaxID=3239936 RepID=UPI003D8D732E
MTLRGIARIAAATAAVVLSIGGLGLPAQAEQTPSPSLSPAWPPANPGNLYLEVPAGGIRAATAPARGCAGIDTGVATPGTDGWLFAPPFVWYDWITFWFGFVDEQEGTLTVLTMSQDGPTTWAIDGADKPAVIDAFAKHDSALVVKLVGGHSATKWPAGWSGYLSAKPWIKSPAGLLLIGGVAFTTPGYFEVKDTPFQLLRACAPGTVDAPPTPTAAPSAYPGAGPSLPVTGTNVWVLTGAGIALVAAGVALIVAYRRRRNVKFVS